jgi:hypothetical protein
MRWLPPRKMAARAEWSYAHPWLAGGYFCVYWLAFCYIAGVLQGRARFALVFGVVTSIPLGVLVAINAKRRLGERFDADQQPIPHRRMWDHTSDRFLVWILIFGVVDCLGLGISLALPSRSLATCSLGLLVSAWSSRQPLSVDCASERPDRELRTELPIGHTLGERRSGGLRGSTHQHLRSTPVRLDL